MLATRHALVLAFVATTTAASPGTAAADGFYVTESFGSAAVGDHMAEHFTGGGFAARIALGRRSGLWAFEGFVHISEFGGIGRYDNGGYTGVALGGSAKYFFPVAEHIELYLRGGLNRFMMESYGTYDYGVDDGGPNRGGSAAGEDMSGRGIHYGAGVQIGGKVPAVGFLFWPLFFSDWGPKVHTSLFFDTTEYYTRLHFGDRQSMDGRIGMWTIGFAVGQDF